MLILKKYVPIYRMGNFIDIGWSNTKNFLQLDFNGANINKIRQLLSSGVEIENVKNQYIYGELFERELLTSFESHNANEQTIRNILFMDFLKIDNFKESTIFDKKILIFGAGAAGGLITYLLVQFGYKNVTIIDDDLIEISDVYKTLVYNRKEIGKHKVLTLKKCLKENFGVNIGAVLKSPKNEKEILTLIQNEKPELIIKACDPDLSFRYYLNQICNNYNIPYVYMSYSFDRINIGPFFVPGTTKSDKELEKDFQSNCGKEYKFRNHEKLFSEYTIHPSVSFNINILGSIILKEIIFFHLHKYEFVFSLNKEVFFMPLTMRVFYKDLNNIDKK